MLRCRVTTSRGLTFGNLADCFGVDFLAEIPLDLRIRETSDDGRPIVVSEPRSHQAEVYRQLAQSVRDKLAADAGTGARPFPKIVYM